MKLRYISWIPAVILMGIIFLFSSKPVDNSNESSLTIANSILSVYENISGPVQQEDLRIEKLDEINHIVRKSAHFCEYALLAILIALHLLMMKWKGKWFYILPVLISALYASTDEFHQTMVPGRGGQISDVLLDTTGAITGMVMFGLVLSISTHGIMRRKRKLHNGSKSV